MLFRSNEEGISRGLWADSSPSDSKGKKLGPGPRLSDIGVTGTTGHKSPRRLPFQIPFSNNFQIATMLSYYSIVVLGSFTGKGFRKHK